MNGFADLQRRLAPALAVDTPGSTRDHVLVVLPSHSVSESLRAHYGPRMRALEHRYLVSLLKLARVPTCEMVFVTSQEPEPEVLDYYLSLVPAQDAGDVRRRFRTVVVDDGSLRCVSAKLLDRPDLIDEIGAAIVGRPAYIQPWNVTELEVAVALRVGAPLNGTGPEAWHLGLKSAGRRLLRTAGVPVPYGHEDVRSVDDVVRAAADIGTRRPWASAVVVKHDDSASGDGNVVLRLRDIAGNALSQQEIRDQVERLPGWYLTDLRRGGVVEELLGGRALRSPSVQLLLSPGGAVEVLSTHEQLLGGDGGQVFLGCRFPADPAYARILSRYGVAVGHELAGRGAVGRVSVDFAATRDATGGWRLAALEVNLRSGGTTHPHTVLRHLVPGHYDAEAGRWVTDADGSTRCYVATDNLVEEDWLGLPPRYVIEAVSNAGLQLDRDTGTGVVLHMLSGLAIDGRFGLTAVGRTPEHAAGLLASTRSTVGGLLVRQP